MPDSFLGRKALLFYPGLRPAERISEWPKKKERERERERESEREVFQRSGKTA